jgi:hypothetical protein
VPRLSTLPASRRILAAPGASAWRVGARRLRTVARTATQPPFQLRDPLILAGNPGAQPLDLRLQALVLRRKRQQHLDDNRTARVIDRLRLSALHTTKFDAAELCPPDQLNAYAFGAFGASIWLREYLEPTFRGRTVRRRRAGPA